MVNIPKCARAAVVHAQGQPYTLEPAYPVREPSLLAPGECLIKVKYSGLCHSDVDVKNGPGWSGIKLPLVGGHEGVGEVVAIGEGTLNSPVKVGDRVGAKWTAYACLRCVLIDHISLDFGGNGYKLRDLPKRR